MTKLPQGNRESGWSLVRFPPGSHPEVQAKAGRDRKRSSKTVDESLEHCQLCQYPPACSRSGGFVVRRAPALIHFAPIRRRPPIALSGPADISGAQGTSAPRICQPGVVVPTGQWPFHQTARLGFHAVAHLLIGAEHGRLLCRRMRPRNKVIQFLWPQPFSVISLMALRQRFAALESAKESSSRRISTSLTVATVQRSAYAPRPPACGARESS